MCVQFSDAFLRQLWGKLLWVVVVVLILIDTLTGDAKSKVIDERIPLSFMFYNLMFFSLSLLGKWCIIVHSYQNYSCQCSVEITLVRGKLKSAKHRSRREIVSRNHIGLARQRNFLWNARRTICWSLGRGHKKVHDQFDLRVTTFPRQNIFSPGPQTNNTKNSRKRICFKDL